MVLTKCCRVWRKYKPRSILLESKEIPDHALLFESDVIAILGKPLLRQAVINRLQQRLASLQESKLVFAVIWPLCVVLILRQLCYLASLRGFSC